MQWAAGELFPEPDRDHVEDAFDGAFPVVFCLAFCSGMMRDFDFCDAESFELEDGGDESVHFAVEINTFEAGSSYDLEAATAVVDAVGDKDLPQHIGDP